MIDDALGLLHLFLVVGGNLEAVSAEVAAQRGNDESVCVENGLLFGNLFLGQVPRCHFAVDGVNLYALCAEQTRFFNVFAECAEQRICHDTD